MVYFSHGIIQWYIFPVFFPWYYPIIKPHWPRGWSHVRSGPADPKLTWHQKMGKHGQKNQCLPNFPGIIVFFFSSAQQCNLIYDYSIPPTTRTIHSPKACAGIHLPLQSCQVPGFFGCNNRPFYWVQELVAINDGM